MVPESLSEMERARGDSYYRVSLSHNRVVADVFGRCLVVRECKQAITSLFISFIWSYLHKYDFFNMFIRILIYSTAKAYTFDNIQRNVYVIKLTITKDVFILNESGHEKICLMSYVNNKGADQPAHPRSLISTFVVRCLDSIISLDSIAKISRL